MRIIPIDYTPNTPIGKALLVLILMISTSCIDQYLRHAEIFKNGKIPETPMNMGQNINSEFDDYNSDISDENMYDRYPLCFSSNRHNQGGDFDIIEKDTEIDWSRAYGTLTVDEAGTSHGLSELQLNLISALNKANTNGDQLGPYLIPEGVQEYFNIFQYYNLERFFLLYATNESGNFDIQFIQNLADQSSFTDPVGISFINSGSNELYPSINTDSTRLYFCSDRGGHYDIYSTAISGENILAELSDHSSHEVLKEEVLSSDADDKCPLILGNLMVFTSNRPGGFGGFDLYYSILQNGVWSSPVNFGDKINTSFDEYRPFVKNMGPGYLNDLMIFSSNRPGGLGGFDLYYVGIDRMTGFDN